MRTIHGMKVFRTLAVAVERSLPGKYHWVLLESFGDVQGYEAFARAGTPQLTYRAALREGCGALLARAVDPEFGPSDDENEDADPVG